MSEFKRENRYIVIKRKDLSLLTDKAVEELENILMALSIAKQPDIDTGANSEVDCVVVERDWPIYEETWENVKRLDKGGETLAQENKRLKAELEYHKKVAEALRQVEGELKNELEAIKRKSNPVARVEKIYEDGPDESDQPEDFQFIWLKRYFCDGDLLYAEPIHELESLKARAVDEVSLLNRLKVLKEKRNCPNHSPEYFSSWITVIGDLEFRIAKKEFELKEQER